MKKQFLDYMYDQRAQVQCEIDKLVELNKQPRDGKSGESPLPKLIEAKRVHIQGINWTIEEYIKIHGGILT